jgi:hypothetical protein
MSDSNKKEKYIPLVFYYNGAKFNYRVTKTQALFPMLTEEKGK